MKNVYSSDSSGESNSPQEKLLKLAKHSMLHRLSGISEKQQGGPKLSTLGITVVANEFPQQLQSMYKRQKTDISRKPSSPAHTQCTSLGVSAANKYGTFHVQSTRCLGQGEVQEILALPWLCEYTSGKNEKIRNLTVQATQAVGN